MSKPNYYVPNNLLSTSSAKTLKGEKLGYTTYIMYLSPHTQNSKGKNLCSKASAGCAKACLFNSGAARFDNVQAGKMNKTEYFLHDRKGFMEQLFQELTKIVSSHEAVEGEKKLSLNGSVLRYKNFAVRLNGTSDIPFENLRYKDKDNKNIFELFPEIQFYDYTKIDNRFNKILPDNYHLTFSRSEINHDEVVDVLNRGFNVAVVFGDSRAKKGVVELPKTYLGYPVINGDETDLTFLYPENVVIGLKYKYATGKGTAGVNAKTIEENSFVIDVAKLPVPEQGAIGSRSFNQWLELAK